MTLNNWKFNDECDEWINMNTYFRLGISFDKHDDTWNVVGYRNFDDDDMDGDIFFSTEDENKDLPGYSGLSVCHQWMKDFMRQ